jgi:hypothetical protein
MTFDPVFSPALVGSFGLFFGFSIGPSIWIIRCPTSSTADHAMLLSASSCAKSAVVIYSLTGS